MKTKFLLFIFTLLISALTKAQTVMPTEPQMADVFRSEGKIYVVIAVLAIIFSCIVTYLIYLDLKIRKLEKTKN